IVPEGHDRSNQPVSLILVPPETSVRRRKAVFLRGQAYWRRGRCGQETDQFRLVLADTLPEGVCQLARRTDADTVARDGPSDSLTGQIIEQLGRIHSHSESSTAELEQGRIRPSPPSPSSKPLCGKGLRGDGAGDGGAPRPSPTVTRPSPRKSLSGLDGDSGDGGDDDFPTCSVVP